MKAAVTVLTALLTLVLSASLPAPVEACCLPQKQSCCGQTECGCHMSAPAKPAPTSEMPATTVHAPTEGLMPVWDGHLLSPSPAGANTMVTFAGPKTGTTRLYSLTHAFLI